MANTRQFEGDLSAGDRRAAIFLAEPTAVAGMSETGDRPTSDELRPGMTVEIEQSNADNAPEAEGIRGEIAAVLESDDENVEGAKVRLQSGVTGYVECVVAD